MKKTVLLIIHLFISVLLFSQDYKKDMASLNEVYAKDGFLTIGIKIKVYQESKSSPIIVREALVRKKDKSFFSTMENTKMLLTEKAFLLINESEKDIVVQEIKTSEYNKYINQLLSVTLEQGKESYDSVSYKGIENGNKHYIIYSSQSDIKRADMYLQESTHFLTKLIYHYDSGKTKSYSRIEIEFSNSVEAISEDFFSVSKYVQKSGKGYLLKPAYSKYHLIVNKSEE